MLKVISLVLVAVASLCAAQYADSLKPTISVLNYAQTLEHLENNFYKQGLAIFSQSNFTDAGYNATVYQRFVDIAAQEANHVQALNSTLLGLGANAVAACTYGFNFTTVAAFLATATTLENVGVTAYDGAISQIVGTAYSQTAATIATVEARHAAYLNQLTGVSPFPAAYDTAATSATVLGQAGPFILSCPAANSQCNGIAATSTSVCSGKGTCAFTVCTCASGSYGVDCSLTTAAPTPTPAPTSVVIPADVLAFEALKPNLMVLNYALTLEHLENTFYRNALAAFTQAQFASAGYPSQVYSYFQTIAAHEADHATFLNGTIASLGQAPVQECTYNFNLTSVGAVVGTAQLLENTGVSAYDGAISSLTVGGVAQTAATIATVEARHASYLNTLLGGSGFPNAYDPTATVAQILNATATIFNVCPAANNQCDGVSGSGACNGRGTCAFRVCTCSSGWVGSSCQLSTSGTTASPTTTSGPTTTAGPSTPTTTGVTPTTTRSAAPVTSVSIMAALFAVVALLF